MPCTGDFCASFISQRQPGQRRPKAKRFKGSKAAKRAARLHRR